VHKEFSRDFFIFCKDMLMFVKFYILRSRIFTKILLRNFVLFAIIVTCKTDFGLTMCCVSFCRHYQPSLCDGCKERGRCGFLCKIELWFNCVPASVYTFLTDLHDIVTIIVLAEVGSYKTI
jgi:hypothetical protein